MLHTAFPTPRSTSAPNLPLAATPRGSMYLSLLRVNTNRHSFLQSSGHKGDVQRLTEDLVPISKNRVSPYHLDQPDVDATINRERLELRVNLLSAFPPHGPPFKKSWINVNSYTGTVKIELFRLSGSENHFFRISVTAEKADIILVLPPTFRGVIDAYDHHDRRARLSAPSAFRQRVERGFIRVNDPGRKADDFEDEVFVRTAGRVEFRLMSSDDGVIVGGIGVGAGMGVRGGGSDVVVVNGSTVNGYGNGNTNDGYGGPNGNGNGYGAGGFGQGGSGFASYGAEEKSSSRRTSGFGTIKRFFKKIS